MTPGGRPASHDHGRNLLSLAVRLAAPADAASRTVVLRLAGASALAAIPLTLCLAAPRSALDPRVLFGLFCAALPGAIAVGWFAANQREDQATAAQALCQAGAEQRTARLLTAGRPALFSAAGAAAGGLLSTALRGLLVGRLPAGSALRAILATGTGDCLAAALAAAVLIVLGTLLAGCARRPRLRSVGGQHVDSRSIAALSESTTGTPAVSRIALLDEPPV